MAQKGLRHIALKSRDLKKTEEFYIGVLGCKVAFRHPPSMIFLTTPGSGDLLNFVKSAARTSGTQGLEHIGFKMTAAQLKKMERTLKERGVKIADRRGKDAFYFFDPNGYQIESYFASRGASRRTGRLLNLPRLSAISRGGQYD